MKTDRRQLNILYFVSQCGYWFASCTIFSFSTVFLLHRELSVSCIGVVIALGSILGTVAQPFFAGAVDQGYIRLHTLMKVLVYLLAVCMALLFFVKGPRVLIIAIFLIADILLWVIMSQENSLSIYYVNRGIFLDFGIARAGGSAAFAVASVILGWLAQRFSASAVMIGGGAGLAVLLVSIYYLPVLDETKQECADEKRQKRTASGGFLAFIKKYKKFTAVLIGVAMLFNFHNMNVAYSINIIERFGGNASHLGLGFSLAAFAEIPMLLLFLRVNKRISSNRLLIVAGGFFIVKSFCFVFCGSIRLFYLIQIFNMGSNALILPACVRYADEMMEPGDKYKGQAFVVGADALGNVLGTLLGGFIVDYAGVNAMIRFGVVFAVIGFLLLIFNGKNPEEKQIVLISD
ncbi:MAG: MFS transporter [Eubacteriales bacterium]|nr:MFS transporter [Eubacteriales bacterium]